MADHKVKRFPVVDPGGSLEGSPAAVTYWLPLLAATKQ